MGVPHAAGGAASVWKTSSTSLYVSQTTGEVSLGVPNWAGLAVGLGFPGEPGSACQLRAMNSFQAKQSKSSWRGDIVSAGTVGGGYGSAGGDTQLKGLSFDALESFGLPAADSSGPDARSITAIMQRLAI